MANEVKKQCIICKNMEGLMKHYSNTKQGPLCPNCFKELITCKKCLTMKKHVDDLDSNCSICNPKPIRYARMFIPHNGRNGFDSLLPTNELLNQPINRTAKIEELYQERMKTMKLEGLSDQELSTVLTNEFGF